VTKVNVGLIGVGRMGRIHLTNLKSAVSGARVIAVSHVKADLAEKLSAEMEMPRCEPDYHQLLNNDDIDAVVICSSTDTHAQIISEAAAAGKHIFCEKPLALEMEKIDPVLETVQKAGVKLMIGFHRRFDPSFKKAKELVTKGAIGTPQLVRISSRDTLPPTAEFVKRSGGLFLDMTIHDFDMARYLVGEEVAELLATGNCLVDPMIGELGDLDTAVVLFKYQSGALGSIDNSRKAVYGYDQRIEVFGSEGSVIVGNKTPTEVLINRASSVEKDKPLFFFLERYQDSYLAEMNHFINCILADQTPLVGGDDGKISLAMCYAAQESLSKGTFVKIMPD
jgi:myo-inositol 2-dehydrogenase/D-chiro-inositol 1-dehydrogenase